MRSQERRSSAREGCSASGGRRRLKNIASEACVRLSEANGTESVKKSSVFE